MRGVTFEEGSAEKVFGNLSELMDVVQYDWYIDDLDLNYIGFRSGKYGGEAFRNVLGELSELSFARIRRYPVGAQIDRIDTYEEYAESNCGFLILFYDGGFFELYEKDEALVAKTMDFCLKHAFENAEYIDGAPGGRKDMHF